MLKMHICVTRSQCVNTEQKQFIAKMYIFNVWKCPVNVEVLLTEF
jgi:hypothetical protein